MNKTIVVDFYGANFDNLSDSDRDLAQAIFFENADLAQSGILGATEAIQATLSDWEENGFEVEDSEGFAETVSKQGGEYAVLKGLGMGN